MRFEKITEKDSHYIHWKQNQPKSFCQEFIEKIKSQYWLWAMF